MKKYLEPQIKLVPVGTADIITASMYENDPTDPVKAAYSAWGDILDGFENNGM